MLDCILLLMKYKVHTKPLKPSELLNMTDVENIESNDEENIADEPQSISSKWNQFRHTIREDILGSISTSNGYARADILWYQVDQYKVRNRQINRIYLLLIILISYDRTNKWLEHQRIIIHLISILVHCILLVLYYLLFSHSMNTLQDL